MITLILGIVIGFVLTMVIGVAYLCWLLKGGLW